MRTRIDTPDGDVTGPKLACLHHLDPPYPGVRRWRALRAARLEHRDLLRRRPAARPRGDRRAHLVRRRRVGHRDRPLPRSAQEEAELLREAVERDCRSSASASAPSCWPTRSAAASGGCRGARCSVGASWRASPTTSCCRTRCGRCTGTRTRSSRRPGAVELLDARRRSAARRSGSAARGACSSTPTSTPPTLDGWYERYGDWLAGAGIDAAAARAADAEHLPGQPRPRRRSSAASSDALEQREAVRRGELGDLRAPRAARAARRSARRATRRRGRRAAGASRPAASAPARRPAPRPPRARTRRRPRPRSTGS